MSDAPQQTPVRIALLGSGVFARGAHVPALNQLRNRFEVVAVQSRRAENARTVADMADGSPDVHTDIDEVLARDDVEAVDVVLPIPLLANVVRRALDAGKHVVSEKPIAPTVAEAEELARLHDSLDGRVWMVAENFRYEAAFVRAAELVRDGAIGTPILCTWSAHAPIRPGHRYHETQWRRTGEVPGGFLLDAGVHFVAAFRMILGEVAEVTGRTLSVHADLPPVDTLAATLRFESGALATFSATFAAGAPWPPELRITGTEGAMVVLRNGIDVTRGDRTERITVTGHTGVPDELAAFADSVRSGRPHRNSPAEALADLRIVAAMLGQVE